MIEAASAEEIDEAHFLLILNKNENIVPAVAKLEGPQAAAFFMLGETTGTSAGGADEAGKFLRVPGTNPFFPMLHDLQGNRFLELLAQNPLEVYVLNTGRVGGPDGDERSRKVRIKHSSAIVKGIAEGTIEWEQDPDFGYLVAASVPGIDEPEILQPRRLYERAGPRGRVPRPGRALQGRAGRVPERLREPLGRDRRRRLLAGVFPAAANASADAGAGRTVSREPGARRADAPCVPVRRRGVLRLAAAPRHATRGRRRARAVRVRGRARSRAAARKLAPATIGRKLAAVRAFLRHALGAERVPDASFAPRRPRRLPDAPRPHEVDVELEAFDG